MTKIVMKANSRGVKAGDEVEVPKETADALVENGHARYASPATAKKAVAKKAEAAS